jgi:hypothetical protein
VWAGRMLAVGKRRMRIAMYFVSDMTQVTCSLFEYENKQFGTRNTVVPESTASTKLTVIRVI